MLSCHILDGRATFKVFIGEVYVVVDINQHFVLVWHDKCLIYHVPMHVLLFT